MWLIYFRKQIFFFQFQFHFYILFPVRGDFKYSEMLINISFMSKKYFLMCDMHLYNNNEQFTYRKYFLKHSSYGIILILVFTSPYISYVAEQKKSLK